MLEVLPRRRQPAQAELCFQDVLGTSPVKYLRAVP